MKMYVTLLLIGFLASLMLNAYQYLNRTELSFENALKHLKKSLIRAIVFYQQYYDGLSQMQLIAKWIEVTREKIKKARPEEIKMLKDLVDGL